MFRDYPDLDKGDRVRYVTRDCYQKRVEGEGVVSLIWLGVEEMCRIEHDDGTMRTVCRAIGDEIAVLSASATHQEAAHAE